MPDNEYEYSVTEMIATVLYLFWMPIIVGLALISYLMYVD